MKISPIYQYNIQNLTSQKKQLKNTNEVSYPIQDFDLPNYQVAFGANIVPKRLNLENEKKFLLRQFTEILKNDLSNVSDEDLQLRAMRKLSAFYADKMQKIYALQQECSVFEQMQSRMNYEQAISTRNSLLKKVKILQNSKPPKSALVYEIPEERL